MISEQSENLLEKMRIASPCSVSWDAMKGDEKKRFCGHCNLHVYNISAMSRSEAEDFISKKDGRMCVRFYRRTDGTVLTQDCPVGLKAMRRRLKMRLGVFASMLFGFSLTAFGQDAKSSEAKSDEPKIKITRTVDSNSTQNTLARLRGTIVDINNSLIPNAKVILTNEKTGNVFIMKTDGEYPLDIGSFAFSNLEAGDYSLQMEAVGFKTLIKKEIEINEQESLDVSVTMDVEATMGVIVMVEDLSVTESKVSEAPIPKRKMLELPTKPKKP